MALALNNQKRVHTPLNKETKPNQTKLRRKVLSLTKPKGHIYKTKTDNVKKKKNSPQLYNTLVIDSKIILLSFGSFFLGNSLLVILFLNEFELKC